MKVNLSLTFNDEIIKDRAMKYNHPDYKDYLKLYVITHNLLYYYRQLEKDNEGKPIYTITIED